VCSIPPSGRTPTSRGSRPVGALGLPRPGDATEDHDTQVPAVGATHGDKGPAPNMPIVVGSVAAGDGSPAPEVESELEMMVAVEVVSSPAADPVVDQDPVASSSGPTASPSSLQPQVAAASASASTNDNIMEESEAILGGPF
jgi:hypothetical protein